MFGPIGVWEMVIILIIALIVFGPRKLPELGRSLGKSLREFKSASNELRNTLDEEIRVEDRQRPAAAASTSTAPASSAQPAASASTSTAPASSAQPAASAPAAATPAAATPAGAHPTEPGASA